jgi:uncharacterized protein (DUF1778 family)
MRRSRRCGRRWHRNRTAPAGEAVCTRSKGQHNGATYLRAAEGQSTTIRVEDDFKARIAAAEQRAGTTSHAFILDAIARAVEQDELEAAFHRVAEERWAHILATGDTVAWDDAKTWLEARARGEHPERPAVRKTGR